MAKKKTAAEERADQRVRCAYCFELVSPYAVTSSNNSMTIMCEKCFKAEQPAMFSLDQYDVKDERASKSDH